jgi:hypothetical protein
VGSCSRGSVATIAKFVISAIFESGVSVFLACVCLQSEVFVNLWSLTAA